MSLARWLKHWAKHSREEKPSGDVGRLWVGAPAPRAEATHKPVKPAEKDEEIGRLAVLAPLAAAPAAAPAAPPAAPLVHAVKAAPVSSSDAASMLATLATLLWVLLDAEVFRALHFLQTSLSPAGCICLSLGKILVIVVVFESVWIFFYAIRADALRMSPVISLSGAKRQSLSPGLLCAVAAMPWRTVVEWKHIHVHMPETGRLGNRLPHNR